jgi:hypothetical protein
MVLSVLSLGDSGLLQHYLGLLWPLDTSVWLQYAE